MRIATAMATLVVALGLCATQGAMAQTAIDGVWRNPKNSVHVRIASCGAAACGHVVWASDKAKRDAAEGGARELIGLQLFRDFVQQKSGAWKGKVFVPDLNATFNGTAEQTDAATLKAKGCLIGGLLCKTQTWRRVEG